MLDTVPNQSSPVEDLPRTCTQSLGLTGLLSGSRWNAAFCCTLLIPVCCFCSLALPYLSPASFQFDPRSQSLPVADRLCLYTPVAHLRLGGCVVSLLRWLEVFTDRKNKVFNPPLPSQACFLRWLSRCLIPDFIAQPSSCLMGSLPLCLC